MTIDDPIKALQQQFENEERSSDPVLPRVAKLISALPSSSPVGQVVRGLSDALLGHLQADRIEKMDLLINTIIDEFRRLEKRLDEMAEQSSVMKARFERWVPLVVDGLNRAERTRAEDRIVRIGLILTNSFVDSSPIESDKIEEMMRIAMELSDRDIQFLKALVTLQGGIVETQGRIDRFNAWMSWPKGPWGERVDGEIDTVFGKLESFGLAVRLAPPNNLTINADFQNRYALLREGLDFARFAQQK
jgi:hypothetical protein